MSKEERTEQGFAVDHFSQRRRRVTANGESQVAKEIRRLKNHWSNENRAAGIGEYSWQTRWNLENVATPFDDSTANGDCSDCITDGPDGFPDLTLKFDRQDLVAAIGEVADRECLVLTLTGNLKEEFGGTPIQGEDVVLILK